MNSLSLKRNRRSYTLLRSLFFISILLSVPSCTPGLYGKLQWSDETLELFESSHILENHSYYYNGPEMQPDAIIAIDNQYVLAPSLWKKIDLTSTQLSQWMERIDNQYRYRYEKYQGAEIIDYQGNRIGAWYSRSDWTVIRQGKGDNEVVIFTPDTTQFYRRAGGEAGPEYK
jgi:hypothetical protein